MLFLPLRAASLQMYVPVATNLHACEQEDVQIMDVPLLRCSKEGSAEFVLHRQLYF